MNDLPTKRAFTTKRCCLWTDKDRMVAIPALCTTWGPWEQRQDGRRCSHGSRTKRYDKRLSVVQALTQPENNGKWAQQNLEGYFVQKELCYKLLSLYHLAGAFTGNDQVRQGWRLVGDSLSTVSPALPPAVFKGHKTNPLYEWVRSKLPLLELNVPLWKMSLPWWCVWCGTITLNLCPLSLYLGELYKKLFIFHVEDLKLL